MCSHWLVSVLASVCRRALPNNQLCHESARGLADKCQLTKRTLPAKTVRTGSKEVHFAGARQLVFDLDAVVALSRTFVLGGFLVPWNHLAGGLFFTVSLLLSSIRVRGSAGLAWLVQLLFRIVSPKHCRMQVAARASCLSGPPLGMGPMVGERL
jgi:hypothetical protein